MRREIINTTRDTRLALTAETARTFRQRLVGLLGRSGLTVGEALILQPCQSVHMFFMRFPLDLVFLDRTGTVIHLITALPPGRVSPCIRSAYTVIELPAGTIATTRTAVGDRVEFGPEF